MGPFSAGVTATPPCKFNLQTLFHLIGQQCFLPPLVTSLVSGQLLQTGHLSHFGQVYSYLCFQGIGNSMGEMLLRYPLFFPMPLLPNQVSQYFCQRLNCTFSGLDAFQPPWSPLLATLINVKHKNFASQLPFPHALTSLNFPVL